MKIVLSAVILLLVILPACENSEESREETMYPLQVGNSWEYLTTFTFTDDSGKIYPQFVFRDSLAVHVQIDRREMLPNSLLTYVFKIVESSSPSFGEQYYQKKTNGLYLVAYRNAGAAPLVQPKPAGKSCIVFHDRKYASVGEILNDLGVDQPVPVYDITSDSVLFETAPLLALKYPLSVNFQWIYREHDPWRIEKKVEDYQTLSMPAGTFNGYRVRWLYDRDGDGEWDEDIYIMDFIAAEGLMRRDIFIRDLVIMGTEGVVLGTYDYHETSLAVAYDLKND